jgi:histone H3/H4
MCASILKAEVAKRNEKGVCQVSQMQTAAVNVLMEAFESSAMDMFSSSRLFAAHAGRSTLMHDDLALYKATHPNFTAPVDRQRLNDYKPSHGPRKYIVKRRRHHTHKKRNKRAMSPIIEEADVVEKVVNAKPPQPNQPNIDDL